MAFASRQNGGLVMPGPQTVAPPPAPIASSSTVATPTTAPKPALTLEQQHITAVDGIVPTLQ